MTTLPSTDPVRDLEWPPTLCVSEGGVSLHGLDAARGRNGWLVPGRVDFVAPPMGAGGPVIVAPDVPAAPRP